MQMRANEKFVDEVNARFKKDDIILLMCRSGGRSAAAVNELAKAGFARAYTIVDGFEGDKLDVPGAVNGCRRVVDGWKNSGGPWTYDVNVNLAYLTTGK